MKLWMKWDVDRDMAMSVILASDPWENGKASPKGQTS